MKPLAIDLYSGLGGWTEGFLSEGYDVIGFDIERRPYPSQLVLQDVLTLHGSQFKDAEIIVGSSPCQEFSYRAMPFKRCKSLGPPLLGIELFQAQFRIQDEANAANACPDCQGIGYFPSARGPLSEECGLCRTTGYKPGKAYIPMVVENVRGAQPWVGRAAWHYGSYYLWGDVPALMPFTYRAQKRNPDGTENGPGSWFAIADSKNRGGRSDDGVKVPGMNWSGSDQPGYKAQAFNTTAEQRIRADGVKIPNNSSARRWEDRPIPRLNAVNKHEDGYTVAVEDSQKGDGGSWFFDNKNGMRKHSSHSAARKAASAQIAKIPFELARYIASVYKPAQ